MDNQIQVIKRGVDFLVDTTDRTSKKAINIIFCHKNETGDFVNGVTSEGLMQVMQSRYQHLVFKDPSEENIQCLLFIRQCLEVMKRRKAVKKLNKDDYKGNGSPVQTGSQ